MIKSDQHEQAKWQRSLHSCAQRAFVLHRCFVDVCRESHGAQLRTAGSSPRRFRCFRCFRCFRVSGRHCPVQVADSIHGSALRAHVDGERNIYVYI